MQGKRKPVSRTASITAQSGAGRSRDSASCMARRVASRMLIRSMISGEMAATAKATAWERMAAAARSRSGAVRHLLSSTPGTRQRPSSTTAAATTGPASEPRPTSSTPAIRP